MASRFEPRLRGAERRQVLHRSDDPANSPARASHLGKAHVQGSAASLHFAGALCMYFRSWLPHQTIDFSTIESVSRPQDEFWLPLSETASETLRALRFVKQLEG